MFSIIEAAGWPIWPLITASVISLAIIAERMWFLRSSSILPNGLSQQLLSEYLQKQITPSKLEKLAQDSPMGHVLATVIKNIGASAADLKESIEEAGSIQAANLERFLTPLGTIASIAPLLGLFGTVVGMIEIFGSTTSAGNSNPVQLAHGISVALYNTAFGLVVAVPSMIFYRHLRARVDHLLHELELQATHFISQLREHTKV